MFPKRKLLFGPKAGHIWVLNIPCRIKAIRKKGLLAFVDVNIAGRLRINDIRLLAYPGQSVRLSLPQKSYQQDGQEQFKDIVVIPDEDLLQCITEAVVAAWETYQREGPWNLAM